MSVAPVIWRISDGRAGHDSQSAGLAEALQRRLDCRTVVIEARSQWTTVRQYLARRYRPGAGLPQPALIIGAGRRTHMAMLAARRSHGGRCIVLMRPSLPAHWFDLCLIPEHDQPRAATNIMATKGALNRMRPGSNLPQRGMILIGGPSRHYRWDGQAIISHIRQIAGHHRAVEWRLADSPRTPESTRLLIRQKLSAFVDYRPYRQCPPDWLARALPDAASVWVSEDSISMVYEALSAGCRVGLLQVPRRHRSGRVIDSIDGLIRDAYVTAYPRWRQTHELLSPPLLLQEADRCAEYIINRFLGGQRWPG